MNKVDILGVKIDEVTTIQALDLVSKWLKKKEKKYIVTPNIEFIMAAQKDQEFKKIINQADLSIPDSGRFNWALKILETENAFKRVLFWPLFFFPKSPLLKTFPIVTGTDFMEELMTASTKNDWSVALLGGRDGIAEKLKHKLEQRYPNILITYAHPGGVVDENGEVLWVEPDQNSKFKSLEIPPTDILFVAFGHGKQEKWIVKNLGKQPVKIMMGVGGAFDYLSGEVQRAPKSWQKYGFEWLYRLLQQPWRAKRFVSLIRFTFLVLFSKKSNKIYT